VKAIQRFFEFIRFKLGIQAFFICSNCQMTGVDLTLWLLTFIHLLEAKVSYHKFIRITTDKEN